MFSIFPFLKVYIFYSNQNIYKNDKKTQAQKYKLLRLYKNKADKMLAKVKIKKLQVKHTCSQILLKLHKIIHNF